MPNEMRHCHGWCHGYPRGCFHPKNPQPQKLPDPPVTPQPGTTQPPPKTEQHAIVYLVDQHDYGKNDDVNKLVRNGPYLKKRWAWHYAVGNLETFNLGHVPTTIELDPSISAVPAPKERTFQWEGFMFDIPGGPATMRVGIVAGADTVKNEVLDWTPGTKPGANNQAQTIDRVVGFAGTYAKKEIPIGTLLQVRRDDKYRILAEANEDWPRSRYCCAYYITSETPKQPSNVGPSKPGFDISKGQLLAEGNIDDTDNAVDPTEFGESAIAEQTGEFDGHIITGYDDLMDQTIPDNVAVAPGIEPWGGQPFNVSYPTNDDWSDVGTD